MRKKKKRKITHGIETFTALAHDGDVIVSAPKRPIRNPLIAYAAWRIKNHQKKLKVLNGHHHEFKVDRWWEVIHVEHYFQSARASFSMEPMKGRFVPLEDFVLKNMYICRINPAVASPETLDHFSAMSYCIQKHNGVVYDIGQLLMIAAHRRKNKPPNSYEIFWLDFGAEKKVCSATETLIWRTGYNINVFSEWCDDLIPPCLFLGYENTFDVIAHMNDGELITHYH